jgi:hypothetical protein
VSVPASLGFLCFQASILNNMLLRSVGASSDKERAQIAAGLDDQIVVVLMHVTEYRNELSRLTCPGRGGTGVRKG